MKLIRYVREGVESYGILENDNIIKIDGDIFSNYESTTKIYKLEDVNILPPVVPRKLIAIGLNYKKHAEEVNKPLPNEPMMFLVSPTAIIGQNETIEIVNKDNRTEHEGELAIVIGKEGKDIPVNNAQSYVIGYTCANDVSDRILQKKDGQFTRAKSFHTYKPLGPVIETEINPDHCKIEVRVNNEVRQQSNTNDMIFSTSELIARVSEVMTLYPGDVILTGTPSGVSPLKEGDIVEIDIEGIGCLTNMVNIKNN